jgi:pyruvate dehydrogenase E1 component beta subunit
VDAILASVRKTNRVVYLEEGWSYLGVGAQIVSMIQEEAFDDLDAPILRVGQADVPMPYAKNLEALAKPNADRVVAACNKVLYR